MVANKYDLSASRYRQAEQDEAYYESPRVTLERLLELERVMTAEIEALQEDTMQTCQVFGNLTGRR